MAKTIVIGCDGSERSEDALALGELLARSLQASPLAASIVPYSTYVLSQETVDEVVERVSAPFLAMAREHLGDHDFGTRATLNESPAAGLHSIAEEEDALLITIGSSHRGAIGRMLLGGVGTSLLTGSAYPVAVAPRGYAGGSGEARVGSIAVGFDGSAEARGGLDAAIGLASKLRSRLLLIGAIEPVVPYYYPVTPFDQQSYVSAAEESLERRLAEAVERGRAAGLEAEGNIVRGTASQSIAEASADADLLVLGSRGFGPLKRALLGSVSSRVIEHATCPVLVMPRGSDATNLGLDPTRKLERSA